MALKEISFPSSEITDSGELMKGLFLCLLNSSRIPPHIALALDGKYYSWTVKKAEVGIPLETILRTIRQKRKSCVFFQLSRDLVMQNSLEASFSAGMNIHLTDQTCLHPIEIVLRESQALRQKSSVVWDILDDFYRDGKVSHVLSMHHPILNGRVHLKRYTRHEVEFHIKSLSSGGEITG